MADNHTQQPFVSLRPSEEPVAPAFGETVPAAHNGAHHGPVEPCVVNVHEGMEPIHETVPEGRTRFTTSNSRPTQRRTNLSSRFFEAVSGGRKVEEPVTYQGPMPGGLGQTLRAYREAMGYTPQDISDRIKFPHQSISALEEERWEDLQEGFLLRALVRQYAEVVQLDPDRAVELLTLSRGSMGDEPNMRYRASNTSTKAKYGTVYAESEAAAQAAARSIAYNVPRHDDEVVDPVVGESLRVLRQQTEATAAASEAASAAGYAGAEHAERGANGADHDSSAAAGASYAASVHGDDTAASAGSAYEAASEPVYAQESAQDFNSAQQGQEALEPVEMPEPVFESAVAARPLTPKERLQSLRQWLQNPENLPMALGSLVVVLLLITIVYLLLTN